MRDFFCHQGKGFKEAPGELYAENQFTYYSHCSHGKTITVFSFKGSRKLSLFCPRLKPLLACGHSMEGEICGPGEGFLSLTPTVDKQSLRARGCRETAGAGACGDSSKAQGGITHAAETPDSIFLSVFLIREIFWKNDDDVRSVLLAS